MGALTLEQIVNCKMLDAIHVYLGLTIKDGEWELNLSSPLMEHVKQLREWFDENPCESFDPEFHWLTFIQTLFAFESTFYKTVDSVSPFVNKFTCEEVETVFGHWYAQKVRHLYPTIDSYNGIGHFWNVMAYMWIGEQKPSDPLRKCILDVLDTAFEHWQQSSGRLPRVT